MIWDRFFVWRLVNWKYSPRNLENFIVVITISAEASGGKTRRTEGAFLHLAPSSVVEAERPVPVRD